MRPGAQQGRFAGRNLPERRLPRSNANPASPATRPGTAPRAGFPVLAKQTRYPMAPRRLAPAKSRPGPVRRLPSGPGLPAPGRGRQKLPFPAPDGSAPPADGGAPPSLLSIGPTRLIPHPGEAPSPPPCAGTAGRCEYPGLPKGVPVLLSPQAPVPPPGVPGRRPARGDPLPARSGSACPLPSGSSPRPGCPARALKTCGPGLSGGSVAAGPASGSKHRPATTRGRPPNESVPGAARWRRFPPGGSPGQPIREQTARGSRPKPFDPPDYPGPAAGRSGYPATPVSSAPPSAWTRRGLLRRRPRHPPAAALPRPGFCDTSVPDAEPGRK